jgi:hypothetical protein|tara:strand:- start:17246 stop:17650 length:405 start_codon:yes stop_codon:yes gene_type:complete
MNNRISLRDVWVEAMDDSYSSALDGQGYEARMVFGIKIVYDLESQQVNIYNTSKGGNFYTEVKNIDPFLEGGWRFGVYTTALQNYREKLDKVEEAVRHEVNGKNNPKQITSLKNARIRLLNKYNNISDKLNKIK